MVGWNYSNIGHFARPFGASVVLYIFDVYRRGHAPRYQYDSTVGPSRANPLESTGLPKGDQIGRPSSIRPTALVYYHTFGLADSGSYCTGLSSIRFELLVPVTAFTMCRNYLLINAHLTVFSMLF